MLGLIGFSPVTIFLAIPIILCLVVPEKQGYEYTKLDKLGVKTNIALGILYAFMSYIGVSTLFFGDTPASHNTDQVNSLILTSVMLGFSIPLLSVASLVTSVLARKRGKSRFSFLIQFIPIPVFTVMMCLIFYMFSL